MTYRVEAFQIVFLGDETPPLGSERLSRSIAEHQADINALRSEMEASPRFSLALEVKDVEVDSIIAADITDKSEVTVFATGVQR